MQTVELKVGLTADVADVESKFASAGGAVTKFGDDVDAASAKADASTSRLDGVADAADNMGSKSSQAAGGLGDLGGALALMPGPLGKVGAGMEAAAPAIQGVTGAADLANLAMGKSVIVQKALTVATKAGTIAQRALNLVMRANPIGLVVTAVLLLVGGLVLAYKKSETFRAIVDKVMQAARDAVGWVVDKLSDLVGWFRDKVPAAIAILKEKAIAAFDAIVGPIKAVTGFVGGLVDKVNGANYSVKELTESARTLGRVAAAALGAVAAAGEAVGDAIRDGNGAVPRSGSGRSITPRSVTNNINVDGSLAADPNALGRVVLDALTQHQARLGLAP